MMMMLPLSLLISLLILILLGFLMRQTKRAGWVSNRLHRLTASVWFRQPWRCGLLVFLFNLIWFGSMFSLFMGGVLYNPGPTPILVIAIPATTISLLVWGWVGANWRGTWMNRFKVGSLGSGFYWVMLAVAWWMLSELPPDTPEQDNFMAGIGLIMGMIVFFVAGISCLVSIAWPRKHQQERRA